MKIFISFLIFVLTSEAIAARSLDPIVRTKVGDVQGRVEDSANGEEYYAFLGIRYAESPEGELRWKDPVPKRPWNDTFDARHDGPVCHQYLELDSQQVNSEDCLLINVFTSNLDQNRTLFPVIIDIHGGGFTSGGTSFDMLKPTYLMDHKVVFASIHYRLGVLGFLSAGTEEIPGNAGLKDQVLALKWVQQNIESFGGDPNQVTIMGYSAGGYSVVAHLVSPMSAGLFHRAIPMSGSITTHFLLPEHSQIDLFQRLAKNVSCPIDGDLSQTIACLRNIPAQTLENFVGGLFEYGHCPIVSFLPVLEENFGRERFFIEQPTKSLKSGHFNKVPVLTGIARNELAFIAFIILNDNELREKMNDNFDTIAPVCFYYERDTDRSKKVSETLRENFIPSTLQNNSDSLIELEKPFADSAVGHGVHRMVQLIGPQVNVFYYKFSFVGRYSLFNYPDDKPWGVEHTDELQYLFESPNVHPRFTPDMDEYKIQKRVTTLFVNFASTGNPNGAKTNEFIGDFEWTPFNTDDQNYLNIGNDLEMQNGLYLHRYRVWDELFPIES